jgi:hypothetical protein
MRDPYKTALERAYELARSGTCRNIIQLRQSLARDGYKADQVQGPMLIRHLSTLMAQSRHPDATVD